MQQFVSVKEAAIHYGLSETEVRRRVASGRLIAERLTRPQGTLLRVMIDVPDETPTTHQDAPPRADSETFTHILSELLAAHREMAAHRERAARAEQRAEDAEIAARRAEQQADDERALSRELEFKTSRAEAHAAELERQLEQTRQAAARPWWLRLLGIQS